MQTAFKASHHAGQKDGIEEAGATTANAVTTTPMAAGTIASVSTIKVLVVGGSGNIGTAIIEQLEGRAHVIRASRSAAGDSSVSLDISDVESIKRLDDQLPDGVDHVVVCCGASTFGLLSNFDSTSWAHNCSSKLLSVTRLVVMLANGTEVRCLKAGGSITVTAGQAARTINKMWPGIATNNAGLEAFVRNAGLDLPRGVRCNAVSPALVRETAVKAGLPLTNTVPAAECAAAYVPLIFGTDTATVVDAGMQTAFKSSHHAGQKDGIEEADATTPVAAGVYPLPFMAACPRLAQPFAPLRIRLPPSAHTLLAAPQACPHPLRVRRCR